MSSPVNRLENLVRVLRPAVAEEVSNDVIDNQHDDDDNDDNAQLQTLEEPCCCHSTDKVEELNDLQRKSHDLLKKRFRPEYFRHHVHAHGRKSAATALTKDSAPWSAFIVVHPVIAFKLRAATTVFQDVDKFFLSSSQLEDDNKMSPGVYLRVILPNRARDWGNGFDAIISVMAESSVPLWAADQFSEIREASNRSLSVLEHLKEDYEQLDAICKAQWQDVMENISERVHVLRDNLAVLTEFQETRRVMRSTQPGLRKRQAARGGFSTLADRPASSSVLSALDGEAFGSINDIRRTPIMTKPAVLTIKTKGITKLRNYANNNILPLPNAQEFHRPYSKLRLPSSSTTVLFFFAVTLTVSAALTGFAVTIPRNPSASTTALVTDDNFYSTISQLIISLFSLYCIVIPLVRSSHIEVCFSLFYVSLILGILASILAVVVYPFQWQLSTIMGYTAAVMQIICTMQLIESVDTVAGTVKDYTN